MQATITSKGQITIPKKLRNNLHLNAGDKVEFVLDKNQQSARITCSTCVYVYVHMYIYIYIYVCIHIYIYIYV